MVCTQMGGMSITRKGIFAWSLQTEGGQGIVHMDISMCSPARQAFILRAFHLSERCLFVCVCEWTQHWKEKSNERFRVNERRTLNVGIVSTKSGRLILCLDIWFFTFDIALDTHSVARSSEERSLQKKIFKRNEATKRRWISVRSWKWGNREQTVGTRWKDASKNTHTYTRCTYITFAARKKNL